MLEKIKNDACEGAFEPGGVLSIYLLAQLYFVFASIGGFFIALTDGLLLRQPFMMLWFTLLFAVGMVMLKSLMLLWDGHRQGYYGVLACLIAYFAFMLDYTIGNQASGLPYLLLIALNGLLLVAVFRPKWHLMTG